MSVNLYLGDAFGWETNTIAKTAISQLRERNSISNSACAKAQLIKNKSHRSQTNGLKVLGYIPIINVIAGIVAIVFSESALSSGSRSHNNQFWIARGVAMILTGPLLAIVDLGKFIFDNKIAAKYNRTHHELINQFDTDHGHTTAFWAGHPVQCVASEME